MTMLVLAVFGVLTWRDILVSDVPAMPAAWASVGAAVSAKTLDFGGAAAVPVSIGAPVRIKIPRIGVNAVIESVGLAADGSMGIPRKPRNVAWYQPGPHPGEAGSAVISGHVDWYGGITGAFAGLRRLKPGDKIAVQDDTGSIIYFVVRESRMYDASADATEVFVSIDGKAHLNLITCAGKWDRRAKQYTQRLVVFADQESN
ncbi:MAG: class F sortase [Patescibacteria group bacterium]|jgi:sortase (surface protein transpeptidase)